LIRTWPALARRGAGPATHPPPRGRGGTHRTARTRGGMRQFRASSSTGRRPAPGLVAPAVRDRRPPVAAEGLRVEFHAGRRLAALVLRPVDERERALDHVRVEAV